MCGCVCGWVCGYVDEAQGLYTVHMSILLILLSVTGSGTGWGLKISG